MNRKTETYSIRRLSVIIFLGWLSMLGFDFLLHAGLLAKLYLQPSPFLLSPEEAFRLIPLGYLSFLILVILQLWLMIRLKIRGMSKGLSFGLKLGGLIWGVFVLGLLSISTADIKLLSGWFFGQTIELGIVGAVIGSGLAGKNLTHLFAIVMSFVLLSIILTVTLQTLGLAPTSGI
jgi:hypothetical protein